MFRKLLHSQKGGENYFSSISAKELLHLEMRKKLLQLQYCGSSWQVSIPRKHCENYYSSKSVAKTISPPEACWNYYILKSVKSTTTPPKAEGKLSVPKGLLKLLQLQKHGKLLHCYKYNFIIHVISIPLRERDKTITDPNKPIMTKIFSIP